MQWGVDGKENRGCRDGAVGGRVQRIDAEKLFVGTVRPENKMCGDDAIGDMVQQEDNEKWEGAGRMKLGGGCNELMKQVR